MKTPIMAEYFVVPRGTYSTYFHVRLRGSACGAPRLQLILDVFLRFSVKFFSDKLLTCQMSTSIDVKIKKSFLEKEGGPCKARWMVLTVNVN